MMTDQMIANTRAALELERKGYERNLAGADDTEEKTKWKDRIASVDASLESLGGSILDGSVDEILDEVGDDADKAAALLEEEQDQKKPVIDEASDQSDANT